MKWAGFLLSWLGSLPSWLQVAYRWCGQPITVLRGVLVLATCFGLVIGYQVGDQGMLVMPKSPQGQIIWPGTDGSAESERIHAGQAAEADSARAKAEAFISVISNHVANADSAEQFRQQLTAAVDRIPADQLQHVIDSVFARPLTGLPAAAGAPTDSPDGDASPAGHR